MADIKTLLDRLGLSEYVARFCAEGFDSWDVVMDIADTDLDSLAVMPIHRQRLKLEISKARTRVGPYQHHLSSRHSPSPSVPIQKSVDTAKDTRDSPLEGRRRLYRRHPKADIHGPKHPLSAYMLFSNDVRKNLQHKQLSFTQMARQVGESWQLFGNAELGKWKLRAASTRELYLQDLKEYKQTWEYKEYQRYLFNFKLSSSISHPRPGRQSISQHAPKSTDADQKVSATRRNRPSYPSLSACPTLQIQHYIKPEAATCQSKLPAPHDSKSVPCLLSDGPSSSTSQSLLKTFYIRKLTNLSIPPATVHSRLKHALPVPLPLALSAVRLTQSPSTITTTGLPQQRGNTHRRRLRAATETTTKTTTEPSHPFLPLLPDSGLGLRSGPEPRLEPGLSSLSALASASQQVQVLACPYSYPCLPRRSYFETVLQSQGDDLSH